MNNQQLWDFLNGEQVSLTGRYFARVKDGYTALYVSTCDQPLLVARSQNGRVEVPEYSVQNGWGKRLWKGRWFPVSKADFLKDQGIQFSLNQGVPDYSAAQC